MCGILACLNYDKSLEVDLALLHKMTNSMIHRGPDDAGYWVQGHVGLGHRRLAIIDLSAAGRQPLCNEDGTVWVTFNGEIYNFIELRQELKARGHIFRTRTDTEVIVHAYEEWGGPHCLARLRGMFAFVIWDSKSEQMFVARDRLGIKPLYYWYNESTLIVASEIKAILLHPDVPKEPDHEALIELFVYRFTLPPRTLFRGVCKLPAGHYLLHGKNGTVIQEYWRPKVKSKGGESSWKEADYLAELEHRLEDIVNVHLVSDVPVGAFLSGGLDSSSLVAIMSKLMNAAVNTYTVGFEGRWHDESAYASAVARSYKTDHHEIRCRSASVDLLQEIIWHLEEPLINTSVIPLYLVAQLASKNVKVVLSGEGSDEVNGGYKRYALVDKIVRLQRWRHALPGVDVTVDWIIRHLPFGRFEKKIRQLNFVTKNKGVECLALSSNILGTSLDEKSSFFSREMTVDLTEIMDKSERILLNGYGAIDDRRQRFFLYDLRGWLENELLVRVDKLTMAHSLEARVPYLDHTLVEFCLCIPPDMKVQAGITKRLLRRAMAKRLPKEILWRKQHGFVVPLGD